MLRSGHSVSERGDDLSLYGWDGDECRCGMYPLYIDLSVIVEDIWTTMLGAVPAVWCVCDGGGGRGTINL